MRKQVFSFMMVLAMVILAGMGAYAQDGLTTATANDVAVGSRLAFNSTGTGTLTWEVREIPTGSDVGAATTAIGGAGQVKYVEGLAATDTTADVDVTTQDFYVWFRQVPSSGNLYCVQLTEDNGTCTTIRRYFVTVFDFRVYIELSDNTGTLDPTDHATDNTWCGTVVKNTMDSTDVASMHADSVNNGTDLDLKTTKTYFTVCMAVDGGSLDLLKWRMRYAVDSTNALYVYKIKEVANSQGGNTAFGAEPDGANADSIFVLTETAEVPISESATDWAANNTLYFSPVTTATADSASWTFEVETHNMLGSADQTWQVQALRVELEKSLTFGTVPGDDYYNNGVKIAYDAGGSETKLTAGSQSHIQTINMSPATQIITVAD